MIPQPAYEAPISTPVCYTPLVQSQYTWLCRFYNRTFKSHEVARTSAFGPHVVPETNQSQIPTNPMIVPQNINQSGQDARQRTPMSPIRNKPINIQTTINSSTQVAPSKKSIAIEIRYKEEKLSAAPTSALT